jgi:hypothetical protein
MKWILGIVAAAAIGSVVFDLTGSSEVAYVVRAIVRGMS